MDEDKEMQAGGHQQREIPVVEDDQTIHQNRNESNEALTLIIFTILLMVLCFL